MRKCHAVTILILLLIIMMCVFREDILSMLGCSYREIYNKKLSENEIEELREEINIQNIQYKWKEELENNNEPIILIYHHTAIKNISPLEIDELHKNKGWNGIGYHYYIRKDGSIYTGRDEESVGSHTKGYNKVSIGVCLEGNFEEEYLTESQMKSLEQLSVYLCLKYDIKDILPHRELGKTLCPGKNFPMEEIKTAVIEEIKSIKVNKSK